MISLVLRTAVRALAPLMLCAALVVPSLASADPIPSYAQQEEEYIHGRIASIDDQYHLRVHDERGFIDHVVLHRGTVILPTGLTLSNGMSVMIAGYNDGREFVANEVTTPYDSYPAPYYGAPVYPYGAPYYNHYNSYGITIGNGGYYRFRYRGGGGW